MAGAGSDQTIAIASAGDGRIIRRLQGCKGKFVTSLAASPDGNTLFYITEGSLWEIPAHDGTARKIAAADGVAVAPNGKDLVVSLVEKAGVRLVRIPLSGGAAQDIRVESGISIDPIPLGGTSLRADGKLLVGIVPRDSWFFRPAVLDLASGTLTRVPLSFTGDTFMLGWAGDGRILSFGERWTTPRESLSGALRGWFERRKPASILQLQEDLAVVGFFFLPRPKLGRETGKPRLPILLAVRSRQVFGEFLSQPLRDVNVK